MFTPIENLGYCVVFSHMERGDGGLTVVVTHRNLSKAAALVEVLSQNYAQDKIYTQEIFNLTELYNKKLFGQDITEQLTDLENYSPESLLAIKTGVPVDYTAQAHPPLGSRLMFNRNLSSSVEVTCFTQV